MLYGNLWLLSLIAILFVCIVNACILSEHIHLLLTTPTSQWHIATMKAIVSIRGIMNPAISRHLDLIHFVFFICNLIVVDLIDCKTELTLILVSFLFPGLYCLQFCIQCSIKFHLTTTQFCANVAVRIKKTNSWWFITLYGRQMFLAINHHFRFRCDRRIHPRNAQATRIALVKHYSGAWDTSECF